MSTRIAVMGAGAVGCYYGGMLARAGHDVVLIGRARHVEAIERDGLRLETATFDEQVRLHASTKPSAARGASLILFCVKSTDTEAAGHTLQPSMDAETLVMTLQNGVDNADRLRAVLRQEIAATVVYVATEMTGPGHVRHHGRGELVIEPSARSIAFVKVFNDAGIPAELSDNVRGALWAKLVLNCAFNPMSAIAQLPYGALWESSATRQTMQDVVDECLAVATADGITIPGDVPLSVRRIAETMSSQYSSTAQDVARGKRSEIDHLNGYVTQRGRALGIATPVNHVLHTLIKLIESKYPNQS